MAIQISGNTVIDNSRQFIPVTISAGSTTGISGQVLKSTGIGLEWGSTGTENYSSTFVGIGSTVVDSGDFTVETYANIGFTSETRKVQISSIDSNGKLIYPPSFSYIKFENETSTSSLTIVPKVIQDVRMEYRGFSAGVNQLYGDDPHVNQLIIHKTDSDVYYYSNGETDDEDFTALELDTSDVVASVVFYTNDFDNTGGGKETSMRVLNDFFRSFVDNVLYTNSGIGTIGDISTNFDNNIGILTSVLPPLYPNFEFFVVNEISDYPFDGPNVSGSNGSIYIGYNDGPDDFGFYFGPFNFGSGYQVGDYIVIPGDEFTNGSTPDNDVTVTVTSVGLSGELDQFSISEPTSPPPLLYPTNSINDGGNDVYDTGNKIVTNLIFTQENDDNIDGDYAIPYNNGQISIGTTYFGGGEYVTKYANSVFAMVSVGSSIKTLGFAGNWGADRKPQPERSQPLYDTTKYTITNFEIVKSSGSWNNENYNVTIDFSKEEAITVDSYNNFFTPISRNPRITKGDDEEIANNILIGENAGEFLGSSSDGNILLGRNAGRGTPGAILELSLTSSTTLVGEANSTYFEFPKGGSGRLARIKLNRDENGVISFAGFAASGSDFFESIGRGFGYRSEDVLTVDGANVGGTTGVDDLTLKVDWVTSNNYNTDYNISIGDGAGKLGGGDESVFIGKDAGSQSTSNGSIFIGEKTGAFSTGSYNNFFGNCAGLANTTGGYNNFIGQCSGYCNTSGSYNNFLGSRAGFFNTTGGYNNFFGRYAGYYNTTGCHNNVLGSFTGISTSASNKIILGRGGAYNQLFDAPDTTKSTQFAVGIRTDESPANYWLVGNENFNVGIGTTNPVEKLDVGGTIKISGGISVGGTTGTNGQVLQSTGIGLTWGTATGGGLIPGAISVYEEGIITPSGGISSISQLNFKGSAITVQGYLNLDGSPGIAATITVSPPGNNGEVLFKENNDFATSSSLVFNSSVGILTIGNGLNVGTGGSIFTVKPDGLVGIGTTNPQTRLQINGVLGFGLGNNIKIGDNTTGANLTSGFDNIFMGIGAGNSTTTGCHNNFFGRYAGLCNTSGRYNNFFGRDAGCCNTTGCNNNFFGRDAGRCNTTGCHNNFFGNQAGFCNTTGCHNNFFGRDVGYYNTTGCHNNFFGRYAGLCNTSGFSNNFFGNQAGFANTTGNSNNFFGFYAGRCNTSGSCNNFFGFYAGRSNTTGCSNNFFGLSAGRCNTTGTHNTFLGAYSGISTSASNKIILGRGNATNQLFDAPDTTKSTQLAIGVRTDSNPANYWLVGNENFNVGIGTTNPTERLHVSGNILASGTVTQNSDITLKTNVQTISNALDKVLQLRGVEYDRIDMDGEHQIGVIAQEIEKIIPEAVLNNGETKSVAYGNLVGVLIEAIKELTQRVIEMENTQ